MEKQKRTKEVWILASVFCIIFLIGLAFSWRYLSPPGFRTFLISYSIVCTACLGWSLNVTPCPVQTLANQMELQGRVIAKFTGQGCQARDEFDWIGKVISVEKGVGLDIAVIRIVKHNFSYGDARDEKEQEIYRQAIVPGLIQEVEGVLIIYS